MILGTRGALRGREDRRYADRLWLLCCAVPSLAFFFLLSFTKPVLGSWPFPSYVTLIVLAGDGLVESWHPYWWRSAVGYGAGAALLLGFPTWLTRLPLPKKTTASILEKMTGHQAHAQALDAARQSLLAATGRQPIFVARYYMTAALDAFYLPDHPTGGVLLLARRRPARGVDFPGARIWRRDPAGETTAGEERGVGARCGRIWQ
jgi:hypothetical protein